MGPGIVKIIDLAFLALEAIECDRPSVDAGRSAGLEACHFESGSLDLFCEVDGRGLSSAPAGDARVRSYVDATAKERAGRDNNAAGTKAPALHRFHTGKFIALEDQSGDGALDCPEAGVLLQQRPNRSAIEAAIALRPGSPHGRTFATVQHPELDHREIGGASHDATHRVNLSDDRSFRHAAYRRIARHLPDSLERAGDQANAAAQARSRDGRFGTGMTGTDDNDVELGFERSLTVAARHPRKVVGAGALVHPRARLANSAYPTATLMPLELKANYPSLLIRRPVFERAGITRSTIDARLGLTDQEFRVEGDLIAIGPILDSDALQEVVNDLEKAGLVYFEDFFDLSGNWPDWLVLYARDNARKGVTGA